MAGDCSENKLWVQVAGMVLHSSTFPPEISFLANRSTSAVMIYACSFMRKIFGQILHISVSTGSLLNY